MTSLKVATRDKLLTISTPTVATNASRANRSSLPAGTEPPRRPRNGHAWPFIARHADDKPAVPLAAAPAKPVANQGS